eukprot:gene10505-biopygen18307
MNGLGVRTLAQAWRAWRGPGAGVARACPAPNRMEERFDKDLMNLVNPWPWCVASLSPLIGPLPPSSGELRGAPCDLPHGMLSGALPFCLGPPSGALFGIRPGSLRGPPFVAYPLCYTIAQRPAFQRVSRQGVCRERACRSPLSRCVRRMFWANAHEVRTGRCPAPWDWGCIGHVLSLWTAVSPPSTLFLPFPPHVQAPPQTADSPGHVFGHVFIYHLKSVGETPRATRTRHALGRGPHERKGRKACAPSRATAQLNQKQRRGTDASSAWRFVIFSAGKTHCYFLPLCLNSLARLHGLK